VFSRKKLSPSARHTLQSILEDVSYTCGALLDDLELPEDLKSVALQYQVHSQAALGEKVERACYTQINFKGLPQ